MCRIVFQSGSTSRSHRTETCPTLVYVKRVLLANLREDPSSEINVLGIPAQPASNKTANRQNRTGFKVPPLRIPRTFPRRSGVCKCARHLSPSAWRESRAGGIRRLRASAFYCPRLKLPSCFPPLVGRRRGPSSNDEDIYTLATLKARRAVATWLKPKKSPNR